MLQKTLFLIFLWCCFIFKIKCEDASTTSSIIIIGAGASGIAAATKLIKNNVTNIKILEAEDRIGGRIFSVKFGDTVIDLGAEFCHGETDNIVYNLTKDLNILKNWQKELPHILSEGRTYRWDLNFEIREFAEDFFWGNISCDRCKSIGDCVDARYSEFTEGDHVAEIVKLSKQWIYNRISLHHGPLDLHDMRAKTQFKYSKGDYRLNFNGLGYKTILDILMQKYPPTATPLPIDDKILLNKEVTKISKWNETGKVEVECKDGTTYSADLVIFSPSVGVLKADHQKLFEPILPEEKIEAIESIGYGEMLKIFMEFSEDNHLEKIWENYHMSPVWGKDEFMYRRRRLNWLTALTALMVVPDNPRVIVGWYAGKELPKIESLSDEEIHDGLKYITKKFMWFFYTFNVSDPINVNGSDVYEPVRFKKEKWYTNPHFRGSYSYESVKGADKGKDWFKEMAKPLLNSENKPTVLFIGEATSPDHYGTVHGAIESGYREAENILKNTLENIVQ